MVFLTGKSFSEAIQNTHYDEILFIELPVQYMKTTSAEHGQNMLCVCCFHSNSMNNLLSYCRLVDARISASEKDLPVIQFLKKKSFWNAAELENKWVCSDSTYSWRWQELESFCDKKVGPHPVLSWTHLNLAGKSSFTLFKLNK